MPSAVRELLESVPATRGLLVEDVHPEHRFPFGARRGEPRNADLAFLGHAAGGTVAVTIEGKADEPFGDTVGDTLAAALQRWNDNDRSGGIGRVMDLVQALLPTSTDTSPQASTLRYQLLTAAAGSLAYAAANNAVAAVLVVHEFETGLTRPELHARNDADYKAFLLRLGCNVPEGSQRALCGPIQVPGLPLFPTPVPLYIGKVTTTVQR